MAQWFNEKNIILFLQVVWVLVQYLLICELMPFSIGRLLAKSIPSNRWSWVRSLLDLLAGSLFFGVLFHTYPRVQWLGHWNLLLIIGVSVLLPMVIFVFTENWLDPLLEKWFVKSSLHYRKSVEALNTVDYRLFVKACLMAPILEEFLARGVIQGQLFGGLEPMIAIGLASLIFAAIHVNLIQVLSALLPSIVLGVLYAATNSLLACMIVHMIYNTLSFVQLKKQLNRQPIGGRRESIH